MSTDRCESAHLPDEVSEDQRLMPSATGNEEDLPPSEPKVKLFFMAELFYSIGLFFNGVTVVVILVNLLHCRSYRLPGMAQ